jgi:hypothetical protein
VTSSPIIESIADITRKIRLGEDMGPVIHAAAA